jgi:hypothetical protein
MLMKITTEYDGLRAGIASEPASGEYLAKRPQPPNPNGPPPETFKVNAEEMQRKATEELRGQIDMTVAKERIKAIKTPIRVQGRDRDHNQATFRLNYALLHEAGKDVEWQSYDHDEHGFIYVRRNQKGVYAPDRSSSRWSKTPWPISTAISRLDARCNGVKEGSRLRTNGGRWCKDHQPARSDYHGLSWCTCFASSTKPGEVTETPSTVMVCCS